MEPATLATVALTLLATKATEKMGEKLGEGVIAEARNLLGLLQRKAPEIVKRFEAATNPNVIDSEAIEEIKRVAAAESEVQSAIAATASAMQQRLGIVVNQAQLAEKIGMVIQGGYNPIQIDTLQV